MKKKFRNHVLPIIVDIYPHLTVGDVNPHDCVRKLMNGWQFSGTKPHIITGSAFGFELMEEVCEKGFYWTSADLDSNKPLWSIVPLALRYTYKKDKR